MNQYITKHTLFNYLSGRSTPLEKQAVEDWLKKSAANQELFYQWLLEWETRYPQLLTDQDTALQNLLQRLDDDESDQAGNPPATASVSRSGWSWYGMAAAVLLLLVGTWLFREPIWYRTYKTGFGQTSTLLLDDGSRVTMNANSSLRVPRFGFDKAVREVLLQGEAEFSVIHTQDHQRFVVKTSDTFQVEVLGTEFSVFARSRGTKVLLKHGQVRVDYAQGTQKQQLLMEPGDLVSMSPKGTLHRAKIERPEAQSAWKEQRYVFNDTSVTEICALLEENFGLKVHVPDPQVGQRTISGNFKAQKAEDLLKVLSEVLNLRVRVDSASTVTLYNPNVYSNPL